MHRHAGESPAGPQQQTRPTLTGHAFGRYRSSGQRRLPGIGQRQECTAGRGNLDRRGDVVATTSQPASAPPHAWWAPTPAPPIGMPQRVGAGAWVIRASLPRQRRGRQDVEPGSPDPLARGPGRQVVPYQVVPYQVVPYVENFLADVASGQAAESTCPQQELRAQRQGCDGPATRPVPPGRSGSAAAPAGSASHGATSTRAGSATAPGGPTTLRRRPGPRAGR